MVPPRLGAEKSNSSVRPEGSSQCLLLEGPSLLGDDMDVPSRPEASPEGSDWQTAVASFQVTTSSGENVTVHATTEGDLLVAKQLWAALDVPGAWPPHMRTLSALEGSRLSTARETVALRQMGIVAPSSPPVKLVTRIAAKTWLTSKGFSSLLTDQLVITQAGTNAVAQNSVLQSSIPASAPAGPSRTAAPTFLQPRLQSSFVTSKYAIPPCGPLLAAPMIVPMKD